MKDLLLSALNRLLNVFPRKTYFLPKNYCINFFSTAYIDNEQLASSYQRDVYLLAKKLILKNKLMSVMDVGCGYGIKLKEFIAPYAETVIGVDRDRSIGYCREHHDFGMWYVDDIQNPTLSLSSPVDLIICSDVIEHLPQPDRLFAYFRRFCHEKTIIVLSTPERDKVRGEHHFGPPPNKAHVREWNREELRAYVSSCGMDVHEHLLVKDLQGKQKNTPTRKYGKTCQVIVGNLSL